MYSMVVCLFLMLIFYFFVVNELGCVVEGYFFCNIVFLVGDVLVDRIE